MIEARPRRGVMFIDSVFPSILSSVRSEMCVDKALPQKSFDSSTSALLSEENSRY